MCISCNRKSTYYTHTYAIDVEHGAKRKIHLFSNRFLYRRRRHHKRNCNAIVTEIISPPIHPTLACVSSKNQFKKREILFPINKNLIY